MANKFYLADGGDVVFDENAVWSKVGTSLSDPADSVLGPGDVADIQPSGTLTRADPQGRTAYTAEEMAVSDNVYPITPIAATNTETWYPLVPSVAVDGVIRIWTPQDRLKIRINGLIVYNYEAAPGFYPTSFAASFVSNIAAGSLVETLNGHGTGDRTMYARLIPFDYTNPG